jgi:hypothetical protein
MKVEHQVDTSVTSGVTFTCAGVTAPRPPTARRAHHTQLALDDCKLMIFSWLLFSFGFLVFCLPFVPAAVFASLNDGDFGMDGWYLRWMALIAASLPHFLTLG